MAVARHGVGPGAVGRALASQVHPVFMLPPVATASFGAILADDVVAIAAAFHLGAVFFAVYTAHVKDGFVDFHHRGEDDDHPLTVRGCRLALGGATAAFLACVAGLWVVAGPVAAAVTAPTWVIGYLHAPQLDGTTVGATGGYPVGVVVALIGGYVVQTGGLAILPGSLAVVFGVLLVGVKIVDDTTDYAYDRRVGKPTVAVIVGRRRARTIANTFMVTAVGLVVVLAVAQILPRSAVLAAIAFGAVAVIADGADAGTATKLLVRGAYVFLAVLVAAVWFHPVG
ncbi:MAG: ubiquinone biosynthesis protein UbiA [Halobacteriaceae archaeon]